VTIHKNWQELIRPNKLDVKPGDDARRKATVVAEPLERGFGLTLGNALRRVLLSSLQGAAVTAVQIDGVLHEFSSIPGVREDVTDIILNIKEISVKMHGDLPKRMVVRKQGPGVVTAGDIQTVGDIEILSEDGSSGLSRELFRAAPVTSIIAASPSAPPTGAATTTLRSRSSASSPANARPSRTGSSAAPAPAAPRPRSAATCAIAACTRGCASPTPSAAVSCAAGKATTAAPWPAAPP